MEEILLKVLAAFGFYGNEITCTSFGNGLINNTWKVTDGENEYILQRINEHVFKDASAIADNINAIGNYLKESDQEYFFVQPLEANLYTMVTYDEGSFRMFPFVKHSHTIDVVENPAQAYEAAKQFGKFTKVLSAFDIDRLNITIPDFHNLSLRNEQFRNALQIGNKARIDASKALIERVFKHEAIVDQYESIRQDAGFKLRVTHHDTKISNVLFNENDKGICVIDLDTIMPGYFISDVGDMMRTYLCPVSEEEKDLSKIAIRGAIYQAIVDGYSSEMGAELTVKEKQCFLYAGKFMIYMQTIRFLTDHLNDDVYYGSKYEGHNFVRAANQMMLLEKLILFATDTST